MARTLFISVEYIKENSIVDGNVDEKYIKTSIDEAQQMKLIFLIGSGIFNQISDQIQAGTLTSLNTTLLNTYIAPALREWALLSLMPYMDLKLTNKGLIRRTSDNSEGASVLMIEKLMDQISNKADNYAKRMINFLIENSDDYPLFLNPGSDLTTIYPTYRPFTGGIYLGKDQRGVTRLDRLKYPGYYGTED